MPPRMALAKLRAKSKALPPSLPLPSSLSVSLSPVLVPHADLLSLRKAVGLASTRANAACLAAKTRLYEKLASLSLSLSLSFCVRVCDVCVAWLCVVLDRRVHW